MTFFLRALFLTGLAGALSLGCVREQGPSNGQGGALDFSVVNNAPSDATVIATGFAIEIDVTRYDAYWQCPDLSKSVPGTRVASVSPQSCGASPEPVALLDAKCDDGCTVTPKSDDGSGVVKLVVTGLRDGAASLHVDVKSTTSSATWGDSYALQFSTAKRIAIIASSGDTGNTSFASMPGASFSWCPELRDANETTLVVGPDAIATSATGDSGVVAFDDSPDSYGPQRCADFAGARPGTASVVFTAQSLTASGSVRIADPNDVVGADLYALDTGAGAASDAGSDAGYDTGADEIGRAPAIGASPLTAVNLTLDDSFVDFASVLRLRDGSRALGGAGNYRSSSDETLFVSSTSSDPEIAREYLTLMPAGNVIGDGTLDATIGSVNVSIPFHITR